MTGETECVVSFVGGSSQQQRLEAGASTGSGAGGGYNWFSRLAISYQTYQRKSKRKEQSYRGVRRRETVGGGGGKRRGMFLKFLVEFIRTIFFIFKQVLMLTKRKFVEYQPVRYPIPPLSPNLETRLFSVRRKIMVLDLDETLIHSHHDNTLLPATEMLPDFYVRVYIENHPVKFYVYKRPHVDYFLSVVSQWYDLVIFTASMQKYGMEVANHLDQNKGILPRRYFRQDCTMDMNGYTKNLSMISEDLSNIFILDNSPSAYRGNPDNAIPITSWFSDPLDTDLLDLLPFLDSLRFTQDVRSVLSRNLHQQSLW
ncbi:PREDICTED: CTD nuclear envelope phosphatase 1A-like isoform X2 [Amphimedon queenslandica]|uniref:FCP1 homology domain-containing protein n=1 Tax=Amphimedon queenslandica TaxID=400682 RepID=A0AAN0J6X2_AMPQE|nr:PREDICTED: CTD nuclear envelope phosphatase 1A-like isoform X2 [Amphimedon queenslandica]|eukprot:XP_019852770.1 PREDICTED: CTD nuclear envelope phosphatase 1A-like isoform X2 [Amphimedon queenslandica]